MRLAVNAIPLLKPLTGVGKYTYNVLRGLRRYRDFEYHYYYGFYWKRRLVMGDAYFKVLKKILLLFGTPIKLINIFNFRMGIKEYLKGSVRKILHKTIQPYMPFDVYFEPNFIPLENIKAKYIVVTVHDFSFYHNPLWHPKDRVKFFSRYFWKNIKKADVIITVSNFVKNEVRQILKFPEDRIKVIHNGYDNQLFKIYPNEEIEIIRKKFNLPEKFVLFVGSIEPRKNLMGLLKAYLKIDKKTRKEFPLVLVGFKGWENKDIMEILNKLKDTIIYLGYVDEKDLPVVYSASSIFVYPSYYEGFGLPVLEAMACGVPVIASRTSGIIEAGGSACYYVNPNNFDEITDAMLQLIRNDGLAKTLVEKGLEHVKNFSWDKSVFEHYRVFKNLK